MTYQSRGNDWLDLEKVTEQANVTTAIDVARGDAGLRWRESRPMVARPSLAQGGWADGESAGVRGATPRGPNDGAIGGRTRRQIGE